MAFAEWRLLPYSRSDSWEPRRARGHISPSGDRPRPDALPPAALFGLFPSSVELLLLVVGVGVGACLGSGSPAWAGARPSPVELRHLSALKDGQLNERVISATEHLFLVRQVPMRPEQQETSNCS